MFTKNFSFDLYYVRNLGWKWSHNSIMDRPFNWAVPRHIKKLEKKNMMPDSDSPPFQRVIVRRSFNGYSYLVMPCRWEDWIDPMIDKRRTRNV